MRLQIAGLFILLTGYLLGHYLGAKRASHQPAVPRNSESSGASSTLHDRPNRAPQRAAGTEPTDKGLGSLKLSNVRDAVEEVRRLALCGTSRAIRDMGTVLSALSTADYPKFLELLPGMAFGNQTTEIELEVFRYWGIRDPSGAISHVRDSYRKSRQGEALKSIVRGWSERDPDNALKWIDSGSSGRLRSELSVIALKELATVAPRTAADAFLGLPESEAKRASLSDMLRSLTAGDHGVAMDLVDKVGARSIPPDALRALAEEMARKDINAALTWVLSLPDGSGKRRSLETIMNGLARDVPAVVWNYVQGLTDHESRRTGLICMANAWARTGVDEGLAWASEHLQGTGLLEDFQGSLLLARAADLPAEAARRFADLPYSDALEGFLVGIVSEWAAEDGLAAASWAGGLESEAARQAALRQLMQAWTATSARAPWDWIKTLPKGDTRDSAVEWYIRAAQKIAPDLAVEAYMAESGQTP